MTRAAGIDPSGTSRKRERTFARVRLPAARTRTNHCSIRSRPVVRSDIPSSNGERTAVNAGLNAAPRRYDDMSAAHTG